ncbi:DUF1330 domain-containing protein [uncultured Bradyrhizobium sp.]|jgi:uncharacterized protein (DUF1330 family)|uniref:DUF1330 domain-containing protein n=1 Tax=uncultured Bradyrhizobium sp. TaxID=199684 RepID=UPI0026241BE7|nr:DUF1330 domain-containing protein [uncultured Bradyrhizobium sp.]
MIDVRLASLFIGAVAGSAITQTVTAQLAPPAYFVAEAVVTNPDADKAVISKLPDTARRYGGKYLARGGNTIAFGGESPHRIIIVAFDSMERIRAWRSDPQVQDLEKERMGIGTTLRHYAVEGLPQ